MTNEDALKAQLSMLTKVSPASIQFHLMKQKLDASSEYIDSANEKQLDMALAGLLLVLCTNPKSISELDFSVTQQDADALKEMRQGLFKKWGLVDPNSTGPTVTGRSDIW